MMSIKAGHISVFLGAIALLSVLIHFWAGPYAPQPKLEDAVAQSAVKIRDATIRALRGEEPPAPARSGWDLDRTVDAGNAGLAGLAIVIAVVGFIRREPVRPAIAGAALGASAIIFQFVAWLAMTLLFVVLVGSVLANFESITDGFG